MNTLDELNEIKELVNNDKKFKYKNIVNFNCDNIKEELNYADKCHNLEEQLGCPLEVRCKVTTDSVIYDENGVEYKVVYTYMDYFDCENPFDNEMGYCDLCAFGWVDYKETWWLKKGKSE